MEPSHMNPTDSVPWREAFPGRVHLLLLNREHSKNQRLSFELCTRKGRAVSDPAFVSVEAKFIFYLSISGRNVLLPATLPVTLNVWVTAMAGSNI